jgi:SAM-dependent methyltransferase
MHDKEEQVWRERAQRVLDWEAPTFWERFAVAPDLQGRSVLEIGCGLGSLCIDMAAKGANPVIGVDILSDDIAFARRFAAETVPDFAQNISFSDEPLAALGDRRFDYVVSKDSFEHIIDVDGMLRAIRERLAPNGKVYIGFSPLYHSPYGDHDRRRTAFARYGAWGKLLAALPWGHVFLERWILRGHSEMRGEPLTSMHQLNLNKMKVGEFRSRIRAAGFRVDSFRVNQGDSKIGRILSAFRLVPKLETYCTYNVYCILSLSD